MTLFPTHVEATRFLATQPRLALPIRLALHLAAVLTLWSLRIAYRRALKALPRALLDDLGMTAFEAEQEALKPFWRA